MCDSKEARTVHYVINPSSGSQTLVQLGMPMEVTKSVALQEVVLPNTIYKVNATNNRLDFTFGGAQSITVPSAAYSASSLCAAIQALMEAAAPNTWAVTYNADTMKVTVAGAGAFTLDFGSGPNVAVSIGPLLGFAAANTAAALSVTATNVIQLFAPVSLYLRLDKLGNHVWVTDQKTGIAQGYSYRITCAVESGAIIEDDVNADYPQVIKLIPGEERMVISQLQVTLCYANGTPVDLNGAGYEFVLEVI